MSEKDAASPADGAGIDLADEQRRILRNAAMAAGLCGGVIAGACYLLPRFFAPPESLAERIAFALQADVFVLIWLVIAARMVSSGRFHSAADNRGSAFSPPSRRIAIKVAFLQNTLEQAVMAVGVHMALASLLGGPALFSIPAAVALFGVGRMAFLRGYPKGAGARSFGMATTAIPTAAGFVWAIGLVVLNILG
ncbi:MAPEG family protein [Cupriavidus sp. Agwp_2]|uniref:MAPEG family protein n=1 Tax=Cupriavidus sp. Agwp_2 TaxID=2897324 RepID=UPI0034609576